MPSSTSSSEAGDPDGSGARRALIALFGVFAAINAIAIGVWLAIPFSPVSEERYLAAVDDHIAMLKTSKGEKDRVILLGGSGVAFSISAETLGEALDRPVYNGGIQAGIGFRNLVDLYADHLDPRHDLIVLIPELELLADDARYSKVWCDVVFLRKALGDLVGQPRCVPHIVHRTYQEIRHHASGSTARDPIYRRSGFNALGDLTTHLSVDRPTPDFSDYAVPDITPEKLGRFEAYVEKHFIARGFEVLYIPAAMPEVACRSLAVDAIISRLSALSTVDSPRHDPERFCLPASMFFDGAGHLNRTGRKVQTESVRQALADAGPN